VLLATECFSALVLLFCSVRRVNEGDVVVEMLETFAVLCG
jgi:hypothetical protein